jgi:hypothetical protein
MFNVEDYANNPDGAANIVLPDDRISLAHTIDRREMIRSMTHEISCQLDVVDWHEHTVKNKN